MTAPIAPIWTLKTFAIKDLKDYHKNPRKITRDKCNKLKDSLSKYGLIDKPICTKEGLIISGHQRKNVLKAEGVKQIECYVPDRELTEKEIEGLNIAMNIDFGEFDYDILGNQWDQMDLIDYGFTPEQLMGTYEEDDKDGQSKDGVKCPTCGKKMKKKNEA